MSNKPLVSICVLSYNRVSELQRCLKSIDACDINTIEIVISEDCSPKKKAINNMVVEFTSDTKYEVNYNSNVKNVGFDRNIGRLISLAKGEFIILITDDDMFVKGSIDKVLLELKKEDLSVGFTPYIDIKTNKVERQYPGSFILPQGMESVERNLFNAILVSGLIFKREKVVTYDFERFKDLIYSQVYLFSQVLLNNTGFYIDVPLVLCVGDGENAFGLNESSENNEKLADRQSPLSNLEYHKSLIRTIQLFDKDNNTRLMDSFSKEYSIRSYTGLCIARRKGTKELKEYWAIMKSLNIEVYLVAHIYYWSLLIFGYKLSDLLFYIPKVTLLSFRQISGGFYEVTLKLINECRLTLRSFKLFR